MPRGPATSSPEETHACDTQGCYGDGYITITTPFGGDGLYGDSSAVHVDFRAGDIRRLIGSQEQNGGRHLVNFSRPAHRNEAHAFGPDSRIGGANGCAHRRHDAGMNRVGADLILGVL